MPTLLSPYLLPLIAMITVLPPSVAFNLGPIPVYFYGVCYAVGLAATYIVITREARRRGLDARLVDAGIVVVAVSALIGGRLYHVIDQWPRFQDNPILIILPPYAGLGVYGGIATGTIAAFLFTKWKGQSFWRWADVIAPGVFVMQAIGRWGNFFNQELYGPPTDLPWGIAIDCAHRVGDHGIPQWPCPPAGAVPAPAGTFPVETTAFHPLFLYESISGIVGAITLLWIARRWGSRMRPGDLFLIWVIWYAAVRFALETFRTGNWTVLGLPTAMIVSIVAIIGSLLVLAIRHRPGTAAGDRWGEPPEPVDDADVVEEIEVDDDAPGADDDVEDVDADAHVDGGRAADGATVSDVGNAADDDDVEIVDDDEADGAPRGGA